MRLPALAALLALAACGEAGQQGASAPGGLCQSVARPEIERALGGPVEAATVATDNGSPDEGCSWLSSEGGGEPRRLSFTIYRKKALEDRAAPNSGKAFYDDESEAMRARYARVGALDKIGDEGLMGVDDAATARRFSAEIVAIKKEDVLVLRIDGADPTAFEAIARTVAQAM